MVMPAAEYTARAGVAYQPPAAPPQAPAYAGAAAQIAVLQAAFQREEKEYEEYRELFNLTKSQMIQAVPRIYTEELADPQLGYATVSPADILAHLLANYGDIQDSDRVENHKLLKTPWNPDTPIETVFRNGTFCRDFAREGGDPISDVFYVLALVEIFEASGVLEKAVEDWERKVAADKTLANCIIHFKAANKHRLNKAAKASKDVLAANAAIEALKAEMTAKFEAEKKARDAETKTLREIVAQNNNNNNNNTNELSMRGVAYCWSCGITNTHRGRNCNAAKPGHEKAASIFNRMGGSEAINIVRNNNGGRRNRRNNRENTAPAPGE
jgi:hypothetical protein